MEVPAVPEGYSRLLREREGKIGVCVDLGEANMDDTGGIIDCTAEGDGWRIQFPPNKWRWPLAAVLLLFDAAFVRDLPSARYHQPLPVRVLFCLVATAMVCLFVAQLFRRVAMILTPGELVVEQVFFHWTRFARIPRTQVGDLRIETHRAGSNRNEPTLQYGDGRVLVSGIPEAAARAALAKLTELEPTFVRHISAPEPGTRSRSTVAMPSLLALRIERSDDRLRIALPYGLLQLFGLPGTFVFGMVAFIFGRMILHIHDGQQKMPAMVEFLMFGFFIVLGILGVFGNFFSFLSRPVLIITPAEVEVRPFMVRILVRRFERVAVRNLRIGLTSTSQEKSGSSGSIRFDTDTGARGFGQGLSVADAAAIRSAIRHFAPELLAPGEG